MGRCSKDKLLGFLGLAGFMGASYLIGNNPEMKAHAAATVLFMRENPWLGVLLHAALSTAITTFGIPFSLVDLGAAWVYPFPAALGMLLFSKTLGSALCFFIAKRVLPESRKASILSHPTVARVNKLLSANPIYYGTLFRLALMPAFVKNYGLALLDIEFKKYITCCLLGSCFGVPAQAYLGNQLGDIYLGFRSAEEAVEADPMVLIGGMAPALAMLVLMPNIARVLLGKDEEDDKPSQQDGKSSAGEKKTEEGSKDQAKEPETKEKAADEKTADVKEKTADVKEKMADVKKKD